jgi:hypothetical protein
VSSGLFCLCNSLFIKMQRYNVDVWVQGYFNCRHCYGGLLWGFHSLTEKSSAFRFSSTQFYQIRCTHPLSTWSTAKVRKFNPCLKIHPYASVSVVVVNSLLATLNSRHALKRGGVHGDQSTEDDITTSVPTNTPIRTILTRLYAVSRCVLLTFI